MSSMPYVIEQTSRGERSYDIFSRLLEDRIVFLGDEVNATTASLLVTQLLYLESKDPNADINFYINSPGGEIHSGMAIYDTMKHIKPKVNTICLGMAASMGAFLLSGGDRRYALPNAEIMIHQPLGGARGQATDIINEAEHMAKIKEKLTKMLAENCHKSYEEVLKDCERDHWMDSKEALAYGIIDEVIVGKK